MQAKIRIEYLNDSRSIESGEDQILLFCMGSEPFGFDGVIYLMIEAYDNLKNLGKLPHLSPENFASELIRLSFYEKIGYCLISPATKLMYKQYDKGNYLTGIPFEYICRFKWDDGEAKYNLELSVAGFGDEISKNMIEWKAVSEIAHLIAYADSIPDIIMNETIPCNECVVRPTCVQPHGDRLIATNPCERLSEYKENEINVLREKLPEWSLPLIF